MCVMAVVELRLFHYNHLHRMWKWMIETDTTKGWRHHHSNTKEMHNVCVYKFFFLLRSFASFIRYFDSRKKERKKSILYSRERSRYFMQTSLTINREQCTNKATFLWIHFHSYFTNTVLCNVFSFLAVVCFWFRCAQRIYSDMPHTTHTQHHMKTQCGNILWFNAVGICGFLSFRCGNALPQHKRK